LNNEGFIKITNKNISVENLTFGKNQMNFICDYDLNLDSTGWKNKFLLQIKNVKIENWKKYIKDEIKGFLNGKIKKDNTSFLDIYLDLDELQISKNDFENINLKTQYNVEKKIYDYSLLLKKEDNINLDVNGFFENENKKINAKCKFNNFDLQIFEIFTEPICDKLSGSLNGALSIFGNFESPKFGGELDLTNGNVSFSDIKTEFHANGHFKGDSEDLQIVNLEIKDNKLGNALLNGKMKIKFNEFPTLDLSGKVNEIQILNTKEKDNHIFYGNLFCSGDVHFFGPLNFLTIAGDVQNEKNSEIFFNFKNEITNYDFIHFIAEEEEKVGKVKKNIAKQVYNGIKLDLGTTINQNLRAFIKIPFSNIEVQGDGNLHIVTTLNEDWNLKGTLNVKKGTYLFSLKNFLNKKFQIKEGGTVNFFGNIDQATLNIVATENIILGKSKDENLVTLKIITSGLLENPNIKYDIDLSKSQNIAADIRSKIKTNEERRNNYFLNLLLFRNFEGNFSNISSNILNLFERTIKKSDAKNLFQISLDSDKLFPDNLSNLNVVYNFSDKFEISKKQKISNKMFNLRDLSEDLEVRYSINDDVKVYTNIEKNQTFNLGFKIFN
jgi:hypothetical protein